MRRACSHVRPQTTIINPDSAEEEFRLTSYWSAPSSGPRKRRPLACRAMVTMRRRIAAAVPPPPRSGASTRRRSLCLRALAWACSTMR